MTEKFEVSVGEFMVGEEAYTLVHIHGSNSFTEKNGNKFIDVAKFWKDNVNMRSDIFHTPPSFMGMLAFNENPVSEIRICGLDVLRDSIPRLKDHYSWNDYISEVKLDRVALLTEVLADMDIIGFPATLYLNDKKQEYWFEVD